MIVKTSGTLQTPLNGGGGSGVGAPVTLRRATYGLEILPACRSTSFFLKWEDFIHVCAPIHTPTPPHACEMWHAHPRRHVTSSRSHTGTLTCKHSFMRVHPACQDQSLLSTYVDTQHEQPTQKLKSPRADGSGGTAALGWARSGWADLTRLRILT